MKKLFFSALVGLLLAFSVQAEDVEVIEMPESLRAQCYERVAAVMNLDAMRYRLKGYTTKRGTDYYEVYRLFRAHRLSSDGFTPLKQLADDIQLSGAMAIGRCIHFFGDMDESTPETVRGVAWISAHQILQDDTLPMIARFEKEFVAFVKSKYGMR